MDLPKPPPHSPATDLDELARTESMITRCEARITAQLELLAAVRKCVFLAVRPHFVAVSPHSEVR